ncbi:MAG: hypothetical protein KJ558_06665 [Gammaproteobacteria bacterium]|nr:hypothetical protein [Gammaproteobacteria bacterium]MBU1654500.1 hypothetical protein [Gammaproteobacteria bacterium]MBU1960687.1 hypothetical protein [Gammaproteobacteria bacterium]
MHKVETAPNVYVHPVFQPDKPRTLPLSILIGTVALIGLAVLVYYLLSGPKEGALNEGPTIVREPAATPAHPPVESSPVAEKPPAPVGEKVVAFPPAPVTEDIPATPAQVAATRPAEPVAEPVRVAKPAEPAPEPVVEAKPAPGPTDNWLTHTVASGESLSTIFRKLGLSSKLLYHVTNHPEGKALAKINPGQRLKVKGGKKDSFEQMIWEKGPGESLVITSTQKGLEYQSTP